MGTVMAVPPSFIVRPPTLKNYITLVFQNPVSRWALNSLIVAVGDTVPSVLVALLAGYAFAKKEFRGKQILFWVILITMMIPFYTILIPKFIWVKRLGLYNTYWGLILPDIFGAGAIFLSRQYMSTLPSQLIDAAKIDGASELQVFFRIGELGELPMAADHNKFKYYADAAHRGSDGGGLARTTDRHWSVNGRGNFGGVADVCCLHLLSKVLYQGYHYRRGKGMRKEYNKDGGVEWLKSK